MVHFWVGTKFIKTCSIGQMQFFQILYFFYLNLVHRVQKFENPVYYY